LKEVCAGLDVLKGEVAGCVSDDGSMSRSYLISAHLFVSLYESTIRPDLTKHFHGKRVIQPSVGKPGANLWYSQYQIASDSGRSHTP
jgi:hypothetical protein